MCLIALNTYSANVGEHSSGARYGYSKIRHLLGDWNPSIPVCLQLVPFQFDFGLFHPSLPAVNSIPVCLKLVPYQFACGSFHSGLLAVCSTLVYLRFVPLWFTCGLFHPGLLAVCSTLVYLRFVPPWFTCGLFHSGLLAVSFYFLVRAALYAEMGSSLPADT